MVGRRGRLRQQHRCAGRLIWWHRRRLIW